MATDFIGAAERAATNPINTATTTSSVNAPGLGGSTGGNIGVLRQGITAFNSSGADTAALVAAIENELTTVAKSYGDNNQVSVAVRSAPTSQHQFIVMTTFGRTFTIAVTNGASMSPHEVRGRLQAANGDRNVITSMAIDAKAAAGFGPGTQRTGYAGMLTSIIASSIPKQEKALADLARSISLRIQADVLGVQAEMAMAEGKSASDVHFGGAKGNLRLSVQNNHAAAEYAQLYSGSVYRPASHPGLSVVTNLESNRNDSYNNNQYSYDDNNISNAVMCSTAYFDLRRVQQQDMSTSTMSARWAPHVVITSMGSHVDSFVMFILNLAGSASYYTNTYNPGYLKTLISMPDGNFGCLRMEQDGSRSMGPLNPDELRNMTNNGGVVPIGRTDANGNMIGAPMFMDMRNPANSGVSVSVLFDINHGNMPMTALRYFDVTTGRIKDTGVNLLRSAFGDMAGININANTMSFSNNVSLRLVCTKVGGTSESPIQLSIPTVLNLMGNNCQLGHLTLDQQYMMGIDIRDPNFMYNVAELAASRSLEIRSIALELQLSKEMISTCIALAAAMNVRIDGSGDGVSNYATAAMMNPSQFIPVSNALAPTLGGGNFHFGNSALF